MKKYLLSGLVIFGFLIYSFSRQDNNGAAATLSPAPASSVNNQASLVPMGGTMKTNMMQYKNGTYTGNLVDAYYGNVQVQITINSGKVSNVAFLDYPHDRETSIMINTQAMPYLKQEAILAQNANVDIVSGATQTSLAFIQSLQSALNQAK
ncbi:MAG: FMN-binding protein [Patescibacteria group bacterium]|nr:FMN-binding protein [Patescibacteria group bacterium]